MARRTKKPCEFCEAEWFQNIELRNAYLAVEVYPDNAHIAIIVQSMDDDNGMNGEDSVEIPMEYCPNCGRRLGF